MTEMGTNTTRVDAAPQEKARIHLGHLDGIRGIAALWVVVEHIITELVTRPDAGQLPHWLLMLLYQIDVGQVPVDIFIVLSGYCLMLPVARTGVLAGGFAGYIKRRARRILPPYYASVALFSILLLLVPALRFGFGTHYSEHVPFLTVPIVASHLLMVHNVSGAWIYQGNGVWWSVATEWQIYFLMPLLLWFWRRGGPLAAIAAGFAIGIVPQALSHGISAACYHFIGLFALGMGAASVGFDPETDDRVRKQPWAAYTVGLWALSVLAVHGRLPIPHIPSMVAMDTLVGLTTAALLLWLGEASRANRRPLALSLAACPIAVSLGAFSYSLYLVHYPVQLLCEAALMRYHVPIGPTLATMTIIGIPLCLGVAYVFHLIFEKPFLAKSPRESRPVLMPTFAPTVAPPIVVGE